MHIYLKYGKTSFRFSLEETKESIQKAVESHHGYIEKSNKDKNRPSFACGVKASQVQKDYEVERRRVLEEKKA